MFEIRNKVALITGGASGIGLEYAKELLRNEAKVSNYKFILFLIFFNKFTLFTISLIISYKKP